MGLAGATAIVTSAVTALAGVLFWGLRTLHRTVRGVTDLVDDWRGEPARPGVAARPGVMARLESMDGRLTRIEAELHPNGGATVRDAVNRIERKIELSIGEGSG